jgi:SAM-dependent methyltransferase
MSGSEHSSFHAVRFGRSAARYEAHAAVQTRMADALLSLWGERKAPGRILEFGCGTGLLTRRVRARFPGSAHLATDASAEMLAIAQVQAQAQAQAQAHTQATPGDASAASHGVLQAGALQFQVMDARGTSESFAALQPYAAHFPVDLVASGALVQWFPDLAAHFSFAGLCAAPNASYLVSGFSRHNFPELNALLSEPPFSYKAFPGHEAREVEAAAAAAGWNVAALLTWDDVEVLPDARAVLTRMQDLGSVRDPREGGRLTRANLAWLLDEYARRFSVEGGVRLTWKPWAALLTRA